MWLLAEKGKNRVFLRLKFAIYLKNLSHQECENAWKVIVECHSWGSSKIVIPKRYLGCIRGSNLYFRLKNAQNRHFWPRLEPPLARQEILTSEIWLKKSFVLACQVRV